MQGPHLPMTPPTCVLQMSKRAVKVEVLPPGAAKSSSQILLKTSANAFCRQPAPSATNGMLSAGMQPSWPPFLSAEQKDVHLPIHH